MRHRANGDRFQRAWERLANTPTWSEKFQRDLDQIVAQKEARHARAARIANASDDALDNEIVRYVTDNGEVNRAALEYRFRQVPGVRGAIDRLLAQRRLVATGPWVRVGAPS